MAKIPFKTVTNIEIKPSLPPDGILARHNIQFPGDECDTLSTAIRDEIGEFVYIANEYYQQPNPLVFELTDKLKRKILFVPPE